jgi:hypothetical protein
MMYYYWTRHGIRPSVLFHMPLGERVMIRAFYEHEREEIDRALKSQKSIMPVVDLLQLARG